MNQIFTSVGSQLLLGLFLCAMPFEGSAQVEPPMAANRQPLQQLTSDELTLQQVLGDLQQHYKISFVYESEAVLGKVVDRNISYDADLEVTLEKILTPQDLKFKKINESSYAISMIAPVIIESNKRIKKEVLAFQVTGTVVDDQGEGLPGVNVLEKGTANGTTTDVNGRFAVNVEGENSVLVFSFIGFETQEVPVGVTTEFSIQLKTMAETLSEVVVVGYGVQKKANLTGAVGSLESKDIEKLNVSQTSQMLAGQVAGLTVIQDSGQPGKEGMNIRIRGMGTFSDAGTDPLVLVDGLASSMDNVDFNDIASVSVLKDAASASIYGTRAANGVILIETKKGSEGKVKMNYHGFFGLQQPTEIPEIVDSWVYAEMANEALKNNGMNPEFTAADIELFKNGTDPDFHPNKRHYDDLLNSGSGAQTSHHLNITGGTAKSSYMVSFGYLNQQGLIDETWFKRYNVRVNLDNKLNDKLKLNVILAGRLGKDSEPTAVDRNPALGAEGILNYAIKIPNAIAGKRSDGYYGNQTGFTVEGWMDSESYRKNDNLNLYSNVSLDWDIVKGLKLTGRAGYDFTLNQYEMFRPVLVVDQFITAGPSDLTLTSTTAGLSTLQAFLNYDLKKGQHAFHFLGGYSQEAYRNDNITGFRDNFPSNTLYELNAGSQSNQQSYGTGYEWALRSYFGRVTYNYNEKYLFEANARYDGSSRFPKDNRYGFFPSLSAAWRISSEEFFNVSWIDELKVRASWGELGNQNIGNYPYQQVLTLGLNTPFGVTEVLSPGAAATVVPNPDINWESTRVADVGLDVGFFGGKLNLTVDYYDKLTSGILYNVTASKVLGMRPSVQNAGVVSNKGVDVEVRYREQVGELKFAIAPNFSYVRNEVEELANVDKDIANGLFVGSSLNSIYGYISDGLFADQADIDSHPKQQRTPKPGTIKFRDISGPNGVPDGIVDADYDRTIIGNTFPRFNYGANLSAQYKNFDVSILLQGVAGVNKIIGGFQGNAFIQGSNPQQWMAEGRWTEQNPDPNAIYPRLSVLSGQEEQFLNSTYIMQNSSFLRINNAQIGYKFPTTLTSRLKLTNFRVYAGVRNVLTFDSFQKGWDPETGVGYPPVRTYNLGVNLNF
jgi:TonB-linked SusC/RagA family outer membrane protein